MNAFLDSLRQELREEEGYRRFAYDDATGKPPILARWVNGQLVPTGGNVTIGHGRNLTGKGLTTEENLLLFENDIQEAIQNARRLFPAFDTQAWSDNRRLGVASMLYNLGLAGFLQFKDTIRAIRQGLWGHASQHALNSRAAHKLPTRYHRIATLLRDG